MALTFYDAWRTVSSTSSNSYKEDFQAFIDAEFEESPTVKTVKHNNIDVVVRVIGKFNTETVSRNNDNYQKIIFKQSDYMVSIGDIFEFDNDKWLCTDISSTPVSKSCSVVKSNNTLTLYKNHILYQIPCVINSNAILDTDENKFLETPSTTIIMRLPNTEITRQIKRGEIYKIGLQNYIVKDINDIVEPGLLRCEIEFSQEEQLEHTYSLTILNGDSIQIAQSQSLTINAELKDNGVVVDSPALLYSSNDTSIATILNTGEVTILGLGAVTFTVSMASDNTVRDSIDVVIVADEQDNYTVKISGLETVKLNYNVILTASVLNNGIVDATKSVAWTVSNQDGSSNQYVSVVSQDGDSITLKATNNSVYINKYVIVRAGKSDDMSVYSEHVVQIKSLF